jgi:hypothetical protein
MEFPSCQPQGDGGGATPMGFASCQPQTVTPTAALDPRGRSLQPRMVTAGGRILRVSEWV